MIGELRRQLILQEPFRTPDGGGGFITSFTDVGANAVMFASLRQLSNAEQFRYSQLESVNLYRITIRWRGDVTTDMRFIDRDNVSYAIISCSDRDGKKNWLEITALRQG